MRISDWSSDVCSSDLWYWDGGLLSNTPLEHVVAAADEDMLVFQVDLFPARGERPHDLEQAWSREKDIRYSSRTRRISDGLVRRRKEPRLIDRMLAKLPEEFADQIGRESCGERVWKEV